MPRTARSTSNADRSARKLGPQNEEPRNDLDFDDDDTHARAGDRASDGRMREEFPERRVREAGRTGGEMRGINASEDDVTADDLAPETLLDEERSHTPDASGREPSDQGLRETRASNIGAGGGLDEAEMADANPVGREEASKLKNKADKHARNPNAFEPHEAAEVAAREHAARKKAH
jgi:hypothetical protein